MSQLKLWQYGYGNAGMAMQVWQRGCGHTQTQPIFRQYT